VTLVEKANLEGPREILAEVVRRAALQRASVGHEALDRVSLFGAGKTLRRALPSVHQRDREKILDETAVYLEHRERLALGLLARRMRGMALLPQELGGAQEGACPHLPPHYVAPRVDHQRQVA